MRKPKWTCRPASLCGSSAILALALVVLLPSGLTPAFGELRTTTAYRQNQVGGTTPKELWRYMRSHPIIDEDGPALANITHDHTIAVRTKKSGGKCRVANIDFTWRFVITLPKAVDEARMSRSTRGQWREFTSYLKRHEEHHRTIFLRCGKKFLAKASRIGGGRTCFGLKTKVKRYIDKQYAACMAKQRDFDRRERRKVANLALSRASRN